MKQSSWDKTRYCGRYHRILSELVDKGHNFRVKDEAFGSAAAIADTADIDTIDDDC
jgi:hypothetical protein